MRSIKLIQKIISVHKARAVSLGPLNTDLRSKAERKAWKKQIETHKKKWVLPVRKAISQLFKEEGAKVVAAYGRTGSVSYTKTVILKNNRLWLELFQRSWISVGKYSTKLVIKAHANSLVLSKTDKTIDLQDPVMTWERYVTKYFRSKTGLKKVEDISNYSIKNIEAVIKRGMTDGLSKSEIADNITAVYKKFVEGDPEEKTQSRAERIANTEVNAATNYASLNTMQEHGTATHKKWMCMFDNSRQWHMDADQQTVPIDEQFDVGDEQLDCPGDGGPDNSVNCNCDMEYETQETPEEAPTSAPEAIPAGE